MELRLRGAFGVRVWRFDRMTTGFSVGLSLDRGNGVHLYTDDDHGTPVVDGTGTRLRLTVMGDDGLITDDAMFGILERISIGWRCDAKEGRAIIGKWTHSRVVVDGDCKHMDIPFENVLPPAGGELRQCVFRIVGAVGSTDRQTDADASSGGDRFEVLELPRCDIRIVPRRPGQAGAVEGVDREGVAVFRLSEDRPSGIRSRPTTDVVPVRGRLVSRDIQLRAMSVLPNVGIWPNEPVWDAQTLLRHLQEDGACAQAHGIGGSSIQILMRNAHSPGSPIMDELLELGPDVDGDVHFGALLPNDLVDRPAWSRLLGNGMFNVEYESHKESIGRIEVDARATPTSMAIESDDSAAMTMRLRIDGHPGSPRPVICQTRDRDCKTLADISSTFGFEGERTAWLRSADRVLSMTVTIRIHQSTAEVVLMDASTGAIMLSIPVSVTLPVAQHGLPDPPWSIDELGSVLDVISRSPTPWSDRRLKSAVAEAIDQAGDRRVRTFLNILLAWLWRQPKDVASTDARALSPTHIDAAATMWLDLAMDLRVPPHPGSWEQALRDASTTHADRLLHVFDSLRQGVDLPWNAGPLVNPTCRVRNRRLARIAGYLEQP